MLGFAVLTSTLALACPQNLANGLQTPASAKQLVTVEAKVARTTYAELRTWRRTGRCWTPAAGPYSATSYIYPNSVLTAGQANVYAVRSGIV